MQCEERRNSRGAAGASSQAGQDPALYRCRRKGDLQGEKKNLPASFLGGPASCKGFLRLKIPHRVFPHKFFLLCFSWESFGRHFPFFWGGAFPFFPLQVVERCDFREAPVTPRRRSWDPGVVAQIRGQQQHGCFFGGRGRCHPAAGATPVCPLSPLAAGCKLRAPKHCTKVAATRVTMLCIYL